jgi:hypothetical protein
MGMLINPTFKTEQYKTSVSDIDQFGVQNIEAWYERQTEYRTSAQDIVMSIASDIQHQLGDPMFERNIRWMLNRLKWITLNKLDNR